MFNFEEETGDYSFTVNEILFFKSTACLEKPFWMQLLFLQDLWRALQKEFTRIFLAPPVKAKDEIPKDPQEASCGSGFYRKLKYHSNS